MERFQALGTHRDRSKGNRSMKVQKILTAMCVASLLCVSYAATITPIATPFTGEVSENLNSVSTGSGTPTTPYRVFNDGGAEVGDLFSASGSVYGSGGVSSTCSMSARSGNFFYSNGGITTWRFDTEATKFGGYFNYIGPNLNGAVKFYDAGGSQIANESFTLICGTWSWRGWESDTPFSYLTIESVGGSWPGRYVGQDDMEVSFAQAAAVPAGSTVTWMVTMIVILVSFVGLLGRGQTA